MAVRSWKLTGITSLSQGRSLVSVMRRQAAPTLPETHATCACIRSFPPYLEGGIMSLMSTALCGRLSSSLVHTSLRGSLRISPPVNRTVYSRLATCKITHRFRQHDSLRTPFAGRVGLAPRKKMDSGYGMHGVVRWELLPGQHEITVQPRRMPCTGPFGHNTAATKGLARRASSSPLQHNNVNYS